jgi:hypothetical protein
MNRNLVSDGKSSHCPWQGELKTLLKIKLYMNGALSLIFLSQMKNKMC